MGQGSPDTEAKGEKIVQLARELKEYYVANGKCLSNEEAVEMHRLTAEMEHLSIMYINTTLRKAIGAK